MVFGGEIAEIVGVELEWPMAGDERIERAERKAGHRRRPLTIEAVGVLCAWSLRLEPIGDAVGHEHLDPRREIDLLDHAERGGSGPGIDVDAARLAVSDGHEFGHRLGMHAAHRTAFARLRQVDLFDAVELDPGSLEGRTTEELTHDAALVAGLLHGDDDQSVDRAGSGGEAHERHHSTSIWQWS